jgi:hypothetical protein
MKFGMNIIAHEPTSTECIPHIVAKQRLSKNVKAGTNTHATIEELLDASFSMLSVS